VEAEWAERWRAVPDATEYSELAPREAIAADELRELDRLAGEFSREWIWFDESPPRRRRSSAAFCGLRQSGAGRESALGEAAHGIAARRRGLRFRSFGAESVWVPSCCALAGCASDERARSPWAGPALRARAMAYVDWGEASAKPLVCVTASRAARATSTSSRQRCAPRLPGDLPDVAGRGDSSWLADPMDYAVPTYTKHMLMLLAQLELESVHWVGTSLGGLIGMAIAAMPGSPVERLVLNELGPVVKVAALQRIALYVGKWPPLPDIEAAERYVRAVSAPFGPHSDAEWRFSPSTWCAQTQTARCACTTIRRSRCLQRRAADPRPRAVAALRHDSLSDAGAAGRALGHARARHGRAHGLAKARGRALSSFRVSPRADADPRRSDRGGAGLSPGRTMSAKARSLAALLLVLPRLSFAAGIDYTKCRDEQDDKARLACFDAVEQAAEGPKPSYLERHWKLGPGDGRISIDDVQPTRRRMSSSASGPTRRTRSRPVPRQTTALRCPFRTTTTSCPSS